MKEINEILKDLEIDVPTDKAGKLNAEIMKNYTATETAESPYMDILREAVDGYRFSTVSEKNAMLEELAGMGLPYSDGKILGLGDAIGQIRSRKAGSRAEGNAEKTPGITKAEIMKIKDAGQRQKAIADNMHLFTH